MILNTKHRKVQKTPLSKEGILNYVSQEEIMKRYLGHDIKLSDRYLNPFRMDKNPECKFYYNSKGVLFFTDKGQQLNQDCFGICQLANGVGFYDALKIIKRDFNLPLADALLNTTTSPLSSYEFVNSEKAEHIKKQLQVDLRKHSSEDYEWWLSFGITKDLLKRFNVFSLDTIYSNKKILYKATPKDLGFVYLFPDDSMKIYRPKLTQFKWLSNCSADVIQGYSQLPSNGKLLIITSSLKDAMTLTSLGYSAIAPQSELCKISPEIIEELKSRFEYLVLLLDNDNAGKLYSDLKSKEWNIPYILMPSDWGKDPSDCYRSLKGDRATIINFINSELNELFHD